jgi:hypothetical protein
MIAGFECSDDEDEGTQPSPTQDFCAKEVGEDVVISRPPEISDGAFQLRMDNIWFCKLLLLFKNSHKDRHLYTGARVSFVYVLEESKGPRKTGHL